ncbi:MAG: arsenic transporter [Ginsengibacter sp.]
MTHIAIWIIALLSIAGIIIRPFKMPEATWAVTGAVLLVLCRLILPSEGITGASKGIDVYLFLTGMMLLAETAREEKLFDWLAAYATKMAKGSASRFFLLIYLVGIAVTVFLSNDATAVVLTPAVAAAAKTAKVKNPLPYLLICAFIANAASFVLPISNPANLVIYGSHMPPLLQWLPTYTLPSIVSITVTFFLLRFTQRDVLMQQIESNVHVPILSRGGKTALWGIAITAIILMASSAFDIQLGLPTAIAGVITSSVVIISAKKNPMPVIKGITWSVLPLVAGLFVIVEALDKTGLIQDLAAILQRSTTHSTAAAMWGSGIIIALSCNLVNNLPTALVMGNVLMQSHVPAIVKSSVLIGVDLGPNLSITGSLATILWLVALRREGISISGWTFLKPGILIMTIALLCALASLWL